MWRVSLAIADVKGLKRKSSAETKTKREKLMKQRLLKWVSARLVAAVALVLPLAAMATPTATAVWRSNLGQSYTIGGNTYAVTPRDGTLNQDGTITVSSTWGDKAPYIDLEGANVGIVSVLVKYSGLDISQIYDADGDSIGVAFASILDSDNNVVGSCVQKVNGVANNTVRAYHCGASAASATPRDIGSMTAVEGSGYLLFAFKDSQGSRSYMGTSIDNLTGGEDTAGHWTGRNLKKLVLGGDESGKAFNGAGFKIEEVAIFVGSYLTASDVADYVFPTVTADAAVTTMSALNAKVASLDNEFLYFSNAAVVTLDEEPSEATKAFLQGANWNGTVFIKDQNIVNLNPTIYGNPNSTLKLSGVSGHWGAAVYEKTATPAIELEDSETEGREYGYFASNGYSFYSQGAYYYVHTPELKGSGTYKANTTGNGALFVADKFDNFTGKLNLEGKTVWLGTGAPTKTVDTWNNLVNFPGTVRLQCNVTDFPDTTGWTVGEYFGTVQVSATPSSVPALFASNVWSGVVQVVYDPGNARFVFNEFGNASSVVEIIGADNAFGALPSTAWVGGTAPSINPAVVLSANWTVSDGWDNATTSFSKLSGAGNLTVNGSSSGATPVPYDIVSLNGYTGTLGGARGQFAIEKIYLDATPTPGDKLVNLNASKEFKDIDLTEVYVNGVLDSTIDLEVKADGIYVASPYVAYVVFQQESGQSFVDVTNYYTTVSNAIEAAKTLRKTIVLTAQPDAGDTYTMSAGDIVNIKKGEFTFDGIIFPEGPQYNNTTTETAGVTQYKCTVNTATIQYPGEEPVGMTGQLIQILGGLYSGYVPGYAGTVVTVLDGSDATVGDAMPEVFTYNSEAHTYTLKTMVASYNNGYTTTYYPTVSNAVANVTSGSTITLVENVDLDEAVEVAAGKNVTIDLNGKTITGPAGGYVFSNAGSVVITGEGAVTSAGGIVTNTASGASVVISNGTYTVTGDLFGNVEGGEIAVSGGTFSAPLDDDYCAEGYEPADLGNGTYGVRIDKGWIYEDYQFSNYTGSWTTPVEYGANNKITLDSDNTYTANKASDGRFVTLNVKASFDDVNDDNSEIAGAKAAVRLAAGDIEGSYVFQLYMATNNIPGCWVNVGASVEATTNTDYTFTLVLDMTNKTYTAQVDGEFLGLITDNAITNFYFATAAATDVVQTLDFRGSGTVTSITGSYENPEAPAQEFAADQTFGSVTLTARQATWLNGQNNYAALAAKIATMDATAFNNAYLLNLDILDEEYDGTYSFTVTEITVGPYEFEGDPDPVPVEAVTIKVELVRKGALDGGINGRLSLKGGNSLPASGFETISEVLIDDETFEDGNVATIVFEKDDEHAAAFYQPVILPIVE